MVTYIEKLSGVLITIVNSDCSSIDTNVKANSEIGRQQWSFRAILLENHLPFQKYSLGCSTVHLSWFTNHNWMIFKVVVNYNLSDSVILNSAFNNTLLEIAQKSEDLYNNFITDINGRLRSSNRLKILPVYQVWRMWVQTAQRYHLRNDS